VGSQFEQPSRWTTQHRLLRSWTQATRERPGRTACAPLVIRSPGFRITKGGSSISPPAADPRWGPYLDARSHVVADLADQVRLNAEAEASAWAAEPNAHMPAELIADVRVWRAATRVDVSELQPHRATPARSRHPNLPRANGDRPWRQLLAPQIPSATADSFLPELAEVEQSLLPNLSADRGRLVRGSAWHLSGTGTTTFR
jgi:hypothetical protein